MQKVTPEVAVELSKRTGRTLWAANPFFLASDCFWEECDDELILSLYDPVAKATVQLFVPQKKENAKMNQIEIATVDDVLRLNEIGVDVKEKFSIGSEYVYRTGDFVALKSRSLRKAVNRFKRDNRFELSYEYDAKEVLAFIDRWAESKDISAYSDIARQVFLWDLKNCRQYASLIGKIPSKNIFVEIDGTLAGFAMTCQVFDGVFVALQQKVDVRYDGLSRFLYHEKAKLYPGAEFFTTGISGYTPSLSAFKEELNPSKKIDLYFLCINNFPQTPP